VILERLPGSRAWILKEGITADLMRIITAPNPVDATRPAVHEGHSMRPTRLQRHQSVT